ncbi:MAG: DNA methyltransferase [bacterium]
MPSAATPLTCARATATTPLRPQTTTLWEYLPAVRRGWAGQHRLPGATPAYVIWNLLERYTRPGDVVMDPFCGSGTTLDVARISGVRASASTSTRRGLTSSTPTRAACPRPASRSTSSSPTRPMATT